MSDGFDPDKYLAEKATGGFDPDAYLAKKSGLPDDLKSLPLEDVKPAPGWLEPKSMSGTALRSFGKGASYGFTDEAGGATGAVDELGRRMRSAIGMKGEQNEPIIDPSKSTADAIIARYRMERDANRDETAAGAKENRKTGGILELAGSFSAPMPAGKLAALRLGGSPLTKLGSRALVGGAYGLAGGAGNSRADLTKADVGGFVGDSLAGAAEGAAGNALLGKAGDAAGAGFRKMADSQALKAIGQRAGISNQLRKMGYESAGEGRQLGRAALDMGLVPKWGTAENVALNARGAKEPTGAMIENALSQADNIRVPLPPRPPPHVEPQQAGWDWKAMGENTQPSATRFAAHPTRGVVETPGAQPQLPLGVQDSSAVLAPFTPAPRPPPGPSHEIQGRPDFDEIGWRAVANVHGPDGLSETALRQSRPAQRLIEDIKKTGKDPNASVFTLNRLKSDMYNGINYGKDSTKLSTTMQRDAVRGVKEGIEAHVERRAGTEVADQLRTANQRYGQLSDIETLAADEATRQLGRGNSLTSLATGAGAASAIGGPAGLAGGAGLAVISNYLKPRMPGVLAHGAAAASRNAPEVARRAANTATHALDMRDEEAVQAWLDGS